MKPPPRARRRTLPAHHPPSIMVAESHSSISKEPGKNTGERGARSARPQREDGEDEEEDDEEEEPGMARLGAGHGCCRACITSRMAPRRMLGEREDAAGSVPPAPRSSHARSLPTHPRERSNLFPRFFFFFFF